MGDVVCNGLEGDKSATAFDTAIALVSIYHMIEWIRWTLFLTATLVGVNLMVVFNGLIINSVYGLLVMIIALITPGGQGDCATLQPGRAKYLQLQIIPLILMFVFCFLPFSIFKMKGMQWTHEMYLKDPEEEDD